MLLGLDRKPIPPSDIVQRLKQVHPALGMYWHPVGPEGDHGCWCFTETWGENDPRRIEVRKGTIDPNMDFDIMGFAPFELSAEDAFGYLTKALRNRPQTKPDYSEMLNRVTNYNISQSAENMKPVTDFAQDMIETNAKTLYRNEGKAIPKVYMNESLAKRSRKGK